MNTDAQSSKKSFAVAAQVIGRALAVSIVLGVILTGVNQTAAVLGSAEFQLLPLILVFLTPFFVVTLSQILGMRAARRAVTQMPRADKGLLSTAISHGIPLRAIKVGLAAAFVNSAIMTIDLIASGKGLSQLPQPLLLQALTLPIIFGVLSQAISFRRTLQTINSSKFV